MDKMNFFPSSPTNCRHKPKVFSILLGFVIRRIDDAAFFELWSNRDQQWILVCSGPFIYSVWRNRSFWIGNISLPLVESYDDWDMDGRNLIWCEVVFLSTSFSRNLKWFWKFEKSNLKQWTIPPCNDFWLTPWNKLFHLTKAHHLLSNVLKYARAGRHGSASE